jgi:putative transposase
MRLAVSDIAGVAGVPGTNRGVRDWLKRLCIPVGTVGNRFTFHLSDLPDSVRQAFLARAVATAGLEPGAFDDVAHAAFLEAPETMRAEAERRAAIAVFLLKLGDAVTWAERAALATDKFGPEGTSIPSLKRLSRAVEGLDPINFAPALLRDQKGGAPRTDMSDDAWAYFLTTIRDAGPQFPLLQAWRDVRDVAKVRGWAWPKAVTVYRRWNDLPEAERLVARLGRDAAIGKLSMPIERDKTTISALDWVSLDGRTLDFWVDFGDGKPVRPVMLALVDVASNAVVGYELGRSENATGTVRLIRRTCAKYGIFSRLYTDNGSSFAGHLVAGGNVHRFRNSGSKVEGAKPLGICHFLGIDLHFALPKNAQAKIAERTFATLSRVIDDRPEFAKAHAGHAPGAAPSSHVVPVPLALAESVIAREIDRHNAETNRRSQGARGRSYQQVFEAGLAKRIKRKASQYQLYLAGLIYQPVTVDKWGRITVDTWTYGGPETQADLLPYHGKGRAVLLGRDPDDFSAPAIAFDADGRLICEGIAHVKRGAYGSKDGIREAAKNRKAARDATTAAEAANGYLDDAAFAAALADLAGPYSPATSPERVVAAEFAAPLRRAPAKGKGVAKAEPTPVPPVYYANMERVLAEKLAKGEKLA